MNIKNSKILIVEDQLLVAEDLKEYIEKLGYNVVGIAPSGEEAVICTEIYKPDLIIMDIKLSGSQDGLKTTAIIRERFEIPVIILTAQIDNEFEIKFAAEQIAAYIIKPYNSKELQINIEIALYKYHSKKSVYQANEKYRLLVEHSTDGVMICDLQGIVVEWNASAEKIFGFHRTEIIGHDLFQIISLLAHYNDQQIDNVQEKITQIFQSQINNFSFQTNAIQARTKEGQIKYVQIKIFSIPFDKVYLAAVITDVNEIEIARLQVLEAKNSYQNLVESINQVILTIDKNYLIKYISPVIEKITGFPSSYFLGKPLVNIMLEENKEDIVEATYFAINNGCANVEAQVIHNLGNEVYVNVSFLTTKSSDPSQLITCVITDITQQKKDEEAIKESEDLYRKILSFSSDPVFIVFQNKIIFSSYSAIHLFEASNSNYFLGKNPSDFINGIENFLITNNSEVATFKEAVIKTTTGQSIDIECTISAIIYDHQLSTMITLRNISERKKIEDEIQKNLLREIELNQMKNHFITMVSHEFRTPLTNILFNVAIFEKAFETHHKENVDKGLERVRSSIKFMTNMLENISLLNKDYFGKLIFSPQNVNLHLFINQIVEDARSLYQSDVSIEVVIEKFIGFVKIDLQLIKTAILNILSNAIKYSNHGAVVLFNIKFTDKSILFTITDSGIGIPKNEDSFIGEPFYRASNVPEYKGSGLGITIVKRCISLHGGEIFIESDKGKGTKFTVAIPLVKTIELIE